MIRVLAQLYANTWQGVNRINNIGWQVHIIIVLSSQCRSGHPVCSNCRPKVNKCPTCRQAIIGKWKFRSQSFSFYIWYPHYIPQVEILEWRPWSGWSEVLKKSPCWHYCILYWLILAYPSTEKAISWIKKRSKMQEVFQICSNLQNPSGTGTNIVLL